MATYKCECQCELIFSRHPRLLIDDIPAMKFLPGVVSSLPDSTAGHLIMQTRKFFT